MALSFANVKTILRSRLSETTASAWTDDELQDYLYLAEQEVLQLLPSDAFWDIQEVEEENEASPSDLYAPLPGTAIMQQLVNVDIKAQSGTVPETTYRRMRVIEPRRWSEYGATIENPTCWFEDGKMYFYPGINEKAHTLKYRYVPAPTEGAVIVPDRYISMVVSFAYSLAIARESVSEAYAEKNEFYQRVSMINQQMYGINHLNRSR